MFIMQEETIWYNKKEANSFKKISFFYLQNKELLQYNTRVIIITFLKGRNNKKWKKMKEKSLKETLKQR